MASGMIISKDDLYLLISGDRQNRHIISDGPSVVNAPVVGADRRPNPSSGDDAAEVSQNAPDGGRGGEEGDPN